MQGFNGFPPGKTPQIRVPSLFFGELLPMIDNLWEMKITLYCFWALQRQEGEYRYIQTAEIIDDKQFMAGMGETEALQVRHVQDGLERATARGILLNVTLSIRGDDVDIYFMNTTMGRNAITAIEKGDWVPGHHLRPIGLIVERPNIYTLYEQNIGPLTQHIAEQLRVAEDDYPYEWIEEAIQIAIERNVRNWRYISAILERWHNEGKQAHGGYTQGTTSQTSGSGDDYSDLIQS